MRTALVGVGVVIVASGCVPNQVGVVAVSRQDDVLLIALVRCDETPVRKATVYRSAPRKPTSDNPSTERRVPLGRWDANGIDEDVAVLDTAAPSTDWNVARAFAGLDKASDDFFVDAWAKGNSRVGAIGFVRSEFEALSEGEWLYYDDPEHVNASTRNLEALRKAQCN